MARKIKEFDDAELVDGEYGSEGGEAIEAVLSPIGGSELSTDMVDEDSPANDKLSLAIRSNEEDNNLYDMILEELAAEASSLKTLRGKAPADDLVSRSIITEKRIAALEKVAKMVSTRSKELKDKAGGKIDFHSENFQNVLSLMTSIIVQAAKETGMQKSTEDRFFLKLQQKLTGFEEMADQAYKGKMGKDAAKNASAFAKTRD